MSVKGGSVYMIPCNKCQELAQLIEEHKGQPYHDLELDNLATALRQQTKGFFPMSASPEDLVLWPGGPNLSDFQFGGGKTKVTLVRGNEVYDNGIPEPGPNDQTIVEFSKLVTQIVEGNYTATEPTRVPLFQTLDEEFEAKYRQHARENYVPGTEIKSVFHPVWQDEARRMNAELDTR